MRPLILLTLLCPSIAVAQTVVTDTGRCRLVERHVPAADVAYQPGIDVNGNAVVPADLNARPVTPPRQITVNLPIPITEFLSQAPPFLDGAEIDAGQVTVDRQSGAIYYQGQRLDSPYAVLCDPPAKPPPLPPEQPD